MFNGCPPFRWLAELACDLMILASCALGVVSLMMVIETRNSDRPEGPLWAIAAGLALAGAIIGIQLRLRGRQP